MPREKRDALLREREILGFLEQSHISPKNLARLRALRRSENVENRVAILSNPGGFVHTHITPKIKKA